MSILTIVSSVAGFICGVATIGSPLVGTPLRYPSLITNPAITVVVLLILVWAGNYVLSKVGIGNLIAWSEYLRHLVFPFLIAYVIGGVLMWLIVVFS